jgi:hypothetical protein
MSSITLPLRRLAHARSGDKGNRANIAVVCHDPASFPWLVLHLTESVVASYFHMLHPASVKRFTLPRLAAFNFVLDAALAGGASQSLRWDSQGKALAAALLELAIPAPPDWCPATEHASPLPTNQGP